MVRRRIKPPTRGRPRDPKRIPRKSSGVGLRPGASGLDLSLSRGDTLYGGGSMDTVYGGVGNDTIVGWNADTIYGGSVMDTIYAGDSIDTLFAGVGDVIHERFYGKDRVQARAVLSPLNGKSLRVTYNPDTGLYLDPKMGRWLKPPAWMAAQLKG